MKTSAEIRETFLQFFESHGHRRVRSSSLVPRNDPTLLFTNAGMNQFKDVFLGREERDYKRAATSQKCMRVSGKHNDLETVGRSRRHHTFFEMLGNFSFGDYFKKGAIDLAWELCTEVYALDKESLRASVYREDDEAYDLWKNRIGLSADRIYRLGKKENFWAMGDTGPCGPCSEVHFDSGVSPQGHSDCAPDCDCGRYLEIWNLVFMQFDRDQSGVTTPLPSPSIDTGMGLERITSLLQGVSSNYDTDLFRPVIDEACRLTGAEYGSQEKSDVSLRILADHSRACAFLISDGVVPGNEGRGYVLRKILRRAIRHAKMLGYEDPIVYTLTSLLADHMKEAYPELGKSRDYAAEVVLNEEKKFSATLHYGLQRLEEIFEQSAKKDEKAIDGKKLFTLYDTYGFPLDLVREIADERNLSIDEKGFYAEMEKQRKRARAAWKGAEQSVTPIYGELAGKGLQTAFTGYDDISEVEGRVLALVRNDRIADELSKDHEGLVVLDRSPFYSEAGGQVGDRGRIESDDALAEVEDTFSPRAGLWLHRVKMQQGVLKTGDRVASSVLDTERINTARNHTATHLLHAALREVLGEHVKQAGSLVAPDRLRFDFTHYKALTHDELRHIEQLVNEKVAQNIGLRIDIRDFDEALSEGAMALFGEKYDDRVRVVTVPGFSMELCGGTHVGRTGDIAVFKITDEGSISAGVRRVEAITGPRAVNRFLDAEDRLSRVAATLRVGSEEVDGAAERLTRQLKESQKRIEQLQLELAHKDSGKALAEVRDIKGIRVLSRKVENLDRTALRSLAVELRNQLKSGVVVLGMPANGKVSLVAMVTPDLTDRIQANNLIQQIAPVVKGGGGGKPEMAEAGGNDPSKLDSALEQTYRLVEEALG